MRVLSMARLLIFMAALVALGNADGQPPTHGIDMPRMPDGHPDLRGIWQALNTANWNLEDHSAALGIPAGQGVVDGGKIPYRSDALANRKENFARRQTEDPEAQCYMAGVPRSTYLPYPFQIVQTTRQLTFLYEYVHSFRNVYIDSEHPPGPIQWWMGDSRAHWEGDTLVVDVIHFTDRTWFDRAGNYHSTALHVIERYTRTGPDHLAYEATIEDANVFTRPWTLRMVLYRRQEPSVQLLEYECYAFIEAARDARPIDLLSSPTTNP
jgi:hypothetical protein